MCELGSVDTNRLADLPDAQAEEEFIGLHRRIERLESEKLARLADLQRRGSFKRDGYLSVASWLAHKLKLGWGQAKDQVRTALALEEMPGTRAAVDEGELSLSAAKVLVQAREVDPDAFSGSEPTLVQAARIHTVGDLKKVTTSWAHSVMAKDSDHKQRQRRRLDLTAGFMGMVRVYGDLDPETGESVLTALQAVLDAESRSGEVDERTHAQRRADALGEVCRSYLDRLDRPVVGGERPHLTLTVDVDALRGDPGTSELAHTGPVSHRVARRLACDASVTRVVMAGDSEPIQVGRRTPVISPALRRAVIARDHHCRFPGCDRPAAWCDAHHAVHWADGGMTHLGNLVLLCRRHHRLVHEPDGFRLQMEDGQPVFYRPDGSVLEEDRAPPQVA